MTAVILNVPIGQQLGTSVVVVLDFEAFASNVRGVTIINFSPQILGSVVAKMKEEELGWLQ